jgi:hypothetical protein
MAQVMTRGMVKSRFIIQWAIRIQVSDIIFYAASDPKQTSFGPSGAALVCSSSTKW